MNSLIYFNNIKKKIKSISYLLNFLLKKKELIRNLRKNFFNLSIETVNTCNADCIFCAYQYQTREKGIMDFDMYKEIIRDFVKTGGGDMSLTPTVGEVFVDKLIIERIKFARSFKEIKSIGFHSNMISLGIHNINDLVHSGITTITLSTSGFDEDMYKRVYRSIQYKRMYRNFIKLLELNRENGEPIDIRVEMRSDKPLKETTNFPDYLNLLRYLPEEKIKMSTRYDNWFGKIKQKDLTGTMKLRSGFDLMIPSRLRISPCSEFYSGPIVYWNGDVGICGCRDVDAKELIIGNVKKNKLTDIWYNKKHIQIMDNFFKETPKICLDCNHYNNASTFFEKESLNKINNYTNIY
tara:strand:+ start:543 stop:1595 length:1053 start_codon:yes stop_codon:yes gene_type:complete